MLLLGLCFCRLLPLKTEQALSILDQHQQQAMDSLYSVMQGLEVSISRFTCQPHHPRHAAACSKHKHIVLCLCSLVWEVARVWRASTAPSQPLACTRCWSA